VPVRPLDRDDARTLRLGPDVTSWLTDVAGGPGEPTGWRRQDRPRWAADG
jgi:hypothetical protein